MPNFKTNEEFFKEFDQVDPVKAAEVPSIEDTEKEHEDAETVIEIEDIAEEEGSQEEPEKAEELEDGEGTASEEEEEEGIIFADDEPEITEEPDYVKISSELGFEGIKNKDQFISKYKSDLEKAKEDALEGLPESLKEAVKFAKDGGDFMAILDASSIDYDKVSNIELVEAKYAKYFKDEDGNFDRDAFEQWVDSEGKAKINMAADQIRNEEKRIQQAKIESIKAKTAEERNKLNAALKSELERIDQIGGVKVTQAQKDVMYNDTVSGLAMEELFYENGKISSKKLAQNLFKVRMFDKAISIAKTSAKNEGKREVINRATNANVQRRAEKPAAEVKVVNPLDQFFESLKKNK